MDQHALSNATPWTMVEILTGSSWPVIQHPDATTNLLAGDGGPTPSFDTSHMQEAVTPQDRLFFPLHLLQMHSPVFAGMLASPLSQPDKPSASTADAGGAMVLDLSSCSREVVMFLLQAMLNPHRCLARLERPSRRNDRKLQCSMVSRLMGGIGVSTCTGLPVVAADESEAEDSHTGSTSDFVRLRLPSLVSGCVARNVAERQTETSSTTGQPTIADQRTKAADQRYEEDAQIDVRKFTAFARTDMFGHVLEAVHRWEMKYVSMALSESLERVVPWPELVLLMERFEYRRVLDFWIPSIYHMIVGSSQDGEPRKQQSRLSGPSPFGDAYPSRLRACTPRSRAADRLLPEHLSQPTLVKLFEYCQKYGLAAGRKQQQGGASFKASKLRPPPLNFTEWWSPARTDQHYPNVPANVLYSAPSAAEVEESPATTGGYRGDSQSTLYQSADFPDSDAEEEGCVELD